MCVELCSILYYICSSLSQELLKTLDYSDLNDGSDFAVVVQPFFEELSIPYVCSTHMYTQHMSEMWIWCCLCVCVYVCIIHCFFTLLCVCVCVCVCVFVCVVL